MTRVSTGPEAEARPGDRDHHSVLVRECTDDAHDFCSAMCAVHPYCAFIAISLLLP